ncbi:MAG: PrsW family intramembrane metalloprotease [Anaerolineales bacterium]|nr:PrsW family intramembrane metalloprotease [Anaerolineales bacterium]
MNIIYPAILLAILFPIAFLAFLGSRNMYRTGKFHYNLLSMGWGIVAYYLAVYVNTTLIHNEWAGHDQVVRFVAPIIEEILKCLIVFYLVRRKDFVYIMDGIAYGFGAGIGFAVLENIEYVMGAPAGMALALALARVFSTNIIHATGTAIVGSALGYSRLADDASRIYIPLGGLLFAIAAHTGFNNLVNSSAALIFAFIYTGVGVFIISLIVRYGLRKASIDIQNNISMLDSITANEAALVNRVRTLDEALKPMAKCIGPEYVAKVKDFLILQAQLGLQRNNLNNAQDDPLRDGIAQEINNLKKRIDEVRDDLGPFRMLQVRVLFPENNIPFWAILEQRVPAAGTGQIDATQIKWMNLPKRATEKSKDVDAK